METRDERVTLPTDQDSVPVERTGNGNLRKLGGKLGICLLVISICLLCLLIVLICFAVLLITKKEEKTYCTTDKCIRAAGAILDSIDYSIDPCDNFYDFVCSKWSKNNPPPRGFGKWDMSGQLYQHNYLVMNRVLETSVISEMKSESEKKAQRFYNSCNSSTLSMHKPVPEAIKKSLLQLGGWSFQEGFNVTKWSLQEALCKSMEHNPEAHPFFSCYIIGDYWGYTKKSINVMPEKSTSSLTQYSTDRLATIEAMMQEFGKWSTGGEKSLIEHSMKEVLELEIKLINVTERAQYPPNVVKWERIPLTELQTQAPFINWTLQFESLMSSAGMDFPGNDGTDIDIYASGYLQEINALVQQYQSDAGKKVLNDYIIWQNFRDLPPFPLNSRMHNCVLMTVSYMPIASGAMFVRETYDAESKPLLRDMIRDIKNGFSKELEGLDWIDQKTKTLLKNTLVAMEHYIDGPNFLINPDELEEYYRDLNITENDFFVNCLSIQKKRARDGARQELNPIVSRISVLDVKAHYFPSGNLMGLLAGSTQRPYIEVGRPKSINYGIYGTIIGQEMTRAFEDIGRRYDLNGYWRPQWTQLLEDKFNEEAKCLKNQYEKFEIDGLHINGSSTLGGNIADNGGIRVAYQAYLDTAKTDDDLKPLPGLNFTDRQLFFISYAQRFCASVTTAYLHQLIQNNIYSPNEFRVLGALSNFEEFSKEFKCKPNSTMNPAHKCRLW